MGMDYVVEDIPLEANFNIQLENPIMDGDDKKKRISFFESQSIIKIIKIK
jgi:hypothetical protein